MGRRQAHVLPTDNMKLCGKGGNNPHGLALSSACSEWRGALHGVAKPCPLDLVRNPGQEPHSLPWILPYEGARVPAPQLAPRVSVSVWRKDGAHARISRGAWQVTVPPTEDRLPTLAWLPLLPPKGWRLRCTEAEATKRPDGLSLISVPATLRREREPRSEDCRGLSGRLRELSATASCPEPGAS